MISPKKWYVAGIRAFPARPTSKRIQQVPLPHHAALRVEGLPLGKALSKNDPPKDEMESWE